MKQNSDWMKEWKIDYSPAREKEVSAYLLNIFEDFWNYQNLDEKSQKTRNRYSDALFSLGGYLVEKSLWEEDADKTPAELLEEYIGPDEGPLVHQGDEEWQKELDTVCRKLYKYMQKKK